MIALLIYENPIIHQKVDFALNDEVNIYCIIQITPDLSIGHLTTYVTSMTNILNMRKHTYVQLRFLLLNTFIVEWK